MALGALIPNGSFLEAAPGRFAQCRWSSIKTNVQTNTYDQRVPAAASRFYLAIARHRSVGGLVLADPRAILC
jgi:hypothetical protein